MWYDATYILVLIGALISLIASWNVNATFRQYDRQYSKSGLTSQEAARRILSAAGISDVEIGRISGNLTDHYSPGEKILRLSDSVMGSSSVAAIGVAAHECGHAIQHKQGYAPLHLRSASVPIVNIGSRLSWPIIAAGLVSGWAGLTQAGIVLFLCVVFFQLITLPVEIDASRRAMKILEQQNLLAVDELSGFIMRSRSRAKMKSRCPPG